MNESRLYELCEQYGLSYDYAWGQYFLSFPFDLDSLFTVPVMVIDRAVLMSWDDAHLEKVVLEYAIDGICWGYGKKE
jgi:hypothetical protein